MFTQHIKQFHWIIVASFMVVLLLAYYFTAEPAVAQGKSPAPPPTKVMVQNIEPEGVQLWQRYSGRMTAVNIADIRPQVSGQISEVRFNDGDFVEEGQILFVIDPRVYQAEVLEAKAQWIAAQNSATFTKKELERAKNLLKTNAISETEFDQRENNARVALAQEQAAKATLEQAEINLGFAHVKAPFDGRVGRIEVTKGNLIEAGPNAPVLTSIVSNNGIYADFDVDERTYLELIRGNTEARDFAMTVPVEVEVDGMSNVYEGFIHSFDNRIDTASGTIRARALFENAEHKLLPGMYVNVKLGRPDAEDAILVHQRAINTNQDRKYVYVINNENKVEYREVLVGESVGGKRVIREGLTAGERVVVDGFMRIRPGALVNPELLPENPLVSTGA